MIKDYVTAEERLANPYVKKIIQEAALCAVCFVMCVWFVWQIIVDITN